MRIAVIAAVAAAMLAVPPAAFAKSIRLIATVGENEGSAISLTTVTGERVTDVPAGVYLIEVYDHSPLHNFHLIGPGVNKATEAASSARTSLGFRGETTWIVTLRRGRYRFACDGHAANMRGSVSVT